ncbi:uncharacterized protein LOC126997838 isoform X2 [Eriocheir sinensis]|uniref:uncharacterized protein LOC126997838 isoform X2 n=1 Tax=Eriocheir sinensis TaxID=95602 RepID=UPI0021C659B8|nr:uncharacterized protein LOC126997838 isoform X2 [Eriocheir sinensis]
MSEGTPEYISPPLCSKTSKKIRKLPCRVVILPVVVTGMVAALCVVVWVMVERLLLENRAANFEPTPTHPVDDLAKMSTIGPGLRWPVVLLLTTVLVLSVGVAGLVWVLSRRPSAPSSSGPVQSTPSWRRPNNTNCAGSQPTQGRRQVCLAKPFASAAGT